MHRPILITLALTLACTTAPEADDEAGTTTSPSSTNAEADADVTASDDDSNTTGDDDPTVGTSSSSSSDDGGVSFIVGQDVIADPCDLFDQDCPEGEKCVLSSVSGEGWDWNRCVPVLGDHAHGDPCTYDGPTEATDDCDATSWCWDADEDGDGVCHAFCGGTRDTPECPPMSTCSINGSGGLSICIPTCNPILQDCVAGNGCYWEYNAFHCLDTNEDIPVGGPCEYVNDCTGGNMCINAESLPACNDSACCAGFCSLESGDVDCVVAGTVCTAFFEQGLAPPEYADVGICVLPP